MNVALRKPMTIADFLAWEERQPVKHEFDGFAVTAMTGATRAHSAIQGNLLAALIRRLRGKPCRAHSSDLKIEAAGSIRYPDAFVACSDGSPQDRVVRDPVVIFEILSESTAALDHGPKNEEFRATPSVRRYVILEQDAVRATVFARDDGRWVGSLHSDAAMPDLPAIAITLPLSELYEEVALDEPDAAAQG
jgi:Uma2 family endonuclease